MSISYNFEFVYLNVFLQGWHKKFRLEHFLLMYSLRRLNIALTLYK